MVHFTLVKLSALLITLLSTSSALASPIETRQIHQKGVDTKPCIEYFGDITNLVMTSGEGDLDVPHSESGCIRHDSLSDYSDAKRK